MATTTPDSIYYPTAGDQIAPLETVFATQASSMQSALTNTRAIKSFRWANEAARTSQTGMAINDIGYQVTTDTIYTYNGSAWVPNDSGWLTPTLQGGNTPNVKYRRKNGIVYVTGTWVPSADNQVLFTLPAGYRPNGRMIVWCERGSTGGPAAKIEIQVGGAFIYRPSSSGTGPIDFGQVPPFPADN